jgi:peptide/nickel transport system permease protein
MANDRMRRRDFLRASAAAAAPWLALWPGVALPLAVFSANMLGDALRDILDPRLRGTG